MRINNNQNNLQVKVITNHILQKKSVEEFDLQREPLLRIAPNVAKEILGKIGFTQIETYKGFGDNDNSILIVGKKE